MEQWSDGGTWQEFSLARCCCEMSFFSFLLEISSIQSSNRCAHLHESHRTLRDGSFGVALSQALVPGYDRTVPPGHFATGFS